MSDLASKQCIPCRGGVPPVKGDERTGFARWGCAPNPRRPLAGIP